MNHKCKLAMACFLVLALLATLCFGCAGEEEAEGKEVITIGFLTDIAGPAGPGLRYLGWGLDDLVKYYNKNDLIPGVQLKVVTYDTKYDPSRDVPGYEWAKAQGAQVIFSPLTTTGEGLKARAENDKIPLVIQSGTADLIDPPGWAFCVNAPPSSLMKPLLKWLSEQWPYERKIKVGCAGWTHPFGRDTEKGAREYCQAHPDEFEWVASRLTPSGTMTWFSEVDKLQTCDYVVIACPGIGQVTFISDFRAKEYTAKFVDTDSVGVYIDITVDKVGWEAVDGTLIACGWFWWNEPYPMVDMAKQLLQEYHAGEAAACIRSGLGYSGGFGQFYLALEILQRAIEEVGAENFDGQAYYDAATSYRMTDPVWEGYPERFFSESKRLIVSEAKLYEWRADVQDLVSVSDWLPLTE